MFFLAKLFKMVTGIINFHILQIAKNITKMFCNFYFKLLLREQDVLLKDLISSEDSTKLLEDMTEQLEHFRKGFVTVNAF